jgi:hypothetical protein
VHLLLNSSLLDSHLTYISFVFVNTHTQQVG